MGAPDEPMPCGYISQGTPEGSEPVPCGYIFQGTHEERWELWMSRCLVGTSPRGPLRADGAPDEPVHSDILAPALPLAPALVTLSPRSVIVLLENSSQQAVLSDSLSPNGPKRTFFSLFQINEGSEQTSRSGDHQRSALYP